MSEQPQQIVQTPVQDQHDPQQQSQHGSAQQPLEHQERHSAAPQQPSTPAASTTPQQSHQGILPLVPAPDTDIQAAASSQQQKIPFHDDTDLGIQQPFIDPTEVITVDYDELKTITTEAAKNPRNPDD